MFQKILQGNYLVLELFFFFLECFNYKFNFSIIWVLYCILASFGGFRFLRNLSISSEFFNLSIVFLYYSLNNYSICCDISFFIPDISSLCLLLVSRSVMSDSLWPHGLQSTRLLCLWNSPSKNTGVGSHSLLQGIFPTHRSNLGLLYCRQILYHLSHQGSLFWWILLIQQHLHQFCWVS